MVCYLFFGLIVTLIAVAIYLDYRKKQPKEVALSEVPAMVRDEALRRVPGLQNERVLFKGGNYIFHGMTNNHPIEVEIKLRGEGDTQFIRKIEIQLETRHSHRDLYDKRPVDLAEVPADIIQQATHVVQQHAGRLDRFDRAKVGKVATGDAYDLKGWSGPWEVEVEITAAGQVLELELKNKTGSGLVHASGAPDQVADCTQADREAIYLAACVVAYADGFKRSEQETLTRIVRELQLPHEVARRTREAARKGSRKCQKPTTDAGRRLMLRYVIQVAVADGKLHEKERRITLRLAKSLGVDEATVLAELHEDAVDAPASIDQRRSDDDNVGTSSPSPMAVLVSQLGEAGVEVEGPDLSTSAGRVAHAAGEQFAIKWSLFSKSALQSLVLVAVTYGVSAIALGWQFQEMPSADGFKEKAFWGGFVIAAFGIVFTFVFSLCIGGMGLSAFRWLRTALEKTREKRATALEKAGDRVSTAVLLVFLIVWFGAWYVMPITFLASITGGLNLAWLCVHLALTRPGFRMMAYIEHGATSLAVLFMGGVVVTGNILAMVILLVAQVLILAMLDRIAHSDRGTDISSGLRLENIGIKLSIEPRTVADLVVRGVFVVAAVAVVLQYPGWRDRQEEIQAVRESDQAARGRLEAIGGSVFETWNPEDGYTATLIKPDATDADLVVLKDFVKIHELTLSGSSITDEGLKNLAHVKSIHSLDLSNTKITDAGMAYLRDVEIEETLNLSSTQVTDKTLEALHGLANVRRVLLADTKVAGPGLQSLQQSRQLIDLDLRHAAIYNDDLPFIRSLARDAKPAQVEFAAWRGLRVQLQGSYVSKAERVRLGELPEFTVWPIERKSNEDPALDVLRLGINEAIAINDKYQVVGWISDGFRNGVTVRRAVLVNPHDADGDGRPDTYMKDADQDGVNDQLVYLGSFRNWNHSAYVADINNRGQIVGYINQKVASHISLDAVHRGFVIDPLDTNDDGEPDTWFQDGGDGRTNLLIKDLGTFGGKRCKPVSIDDEGQIMGWSDDDARTARGFIIEPRDINGDDKPEWFKLGDKPRLNTLMVETGEVTKWKATADAQKANSAGAKLGTTSSGKRRATVMIPR